MSCLNSPCNIGVDEISKKNPASFIYTYIILKIPGSTTGQGVGETFEIFYTGRGPGIKFRGFHRPHIRVINRPSEYPFNFHDRS